MQITTAQDVAGYFLALAQERGEEVNNLKLQKLLYYAQGWHLAWHGEPLFPEKFEAWMSGPVIPAIYWRYKDRGIRAIAPPDVPPRIDERTAAFLEEVATAYVPFDEWELHWNTRAEAPWLNARGGMDDGGPCQNELSEADMEAYFCDLAAAG